MAEVPLPLNSTTPLVFIVGADIGFLLNCSIMIFLMIAGIGFLYGGLSDVGNVSHMISISFVSAAVVALQWSAFGFYLVFDPTPWAIPESLLSEVKITEIQNQGSLVSVEATVHLMYAMLAPALVSGASVGRMKLLPWIVFTLLWTTFVYDLVAWLIWGDGWLHSYGSVDFAGGTVIHFLAGVSGLVVAFYLGEFPSKNGIDLPVPHSLPLYWLGTTLLWAGWMAFNGAAAFHADTSAAVAIFNTAIGGASGYLMYMLLEVTGGILFLKKKKLYWKRKPSAQATGALYGLIAVTPAAGYVSPGEAVAIAVFCVVLNYLISDVILKFKCICCRHSFKALSYDFLGVFVYHGLSGLFGTLLTGLFYQQPNFSVAQQSVAQLVSVGVTLGIGLGGTFLCLLIVSIIFWITDEILSLFKPLLDKMTCSCFPEKYVPLTLCESYSCGCFDKLRKPITILVDKKDLDNDERGFVSVDKLQYKSFSYDIFRPKDLGLINFLRRKFKEEIEEDKRNTNDHQRMSIQAKSDDDEFYDSELKQAKKVEDSYVSY